MTPERRAALLAGVQLSTRAGGAAALALVTAEALRLPYPIYAMISAVIVTDLKAAETRRLSGPRLAGTVVGAALGATLCMVLRAGAGAIAVGVALAMFLCHLLGMPTAAKLAGYTSGLVLLEFHAEPWPYAAFRLIETALGIGVAVAVSLVPKMIRVEQPIARAAPPPVSTGPS